MADPQHCAAFLIIGNEILSGRTQDANLRTLAQALRKRGIPLAEARTVRDEPTAIVAAVNELRHRYGYLFTSGGIGPTHDDITTACIAQSFDRPVQRHPDAATNLRAHYTATGKETTEMRLRMADVPEGAELVVCAVTPAPGFTIDNVFVFAGVPDIFAAMTAAVLPRLTKGPEIHSRSITIHVGESEAAADLAAVQKRHPVLELGSYPKSRDGKYTSDLVVSGTDLVAVQIALQELTGMLDQHQIPWDVN